MTVVQVVGERVSKGDAIVDYEDKVFDDIQAEAGEKAYIFMHTVPFEGSVGLVNMLTATRVRRKGFDTSIVLFGPGSLMASASRGFPTVGDEAFPGALGYNKQLQTFMNEGGKVYACRFSAAMLYGMREVDMMEGVKPVNPLDVLDAQLTARREGALVMQTWTV
ncbi:MSMEG_0572/Sll0783 family nitrogen starvation response protein [Actinomycetospora sp. CA-053990]|uniref:MSMEG_0572/Sll0783 family nitrogen starvation response protein n=1 Tax=Actinomycetospora sp. CA-053990 TaxID=3239891 RepID=UPI003D8F37A0